MPRAPRKCPHPGCDNRITNTRYCPEHTEHHWTNGTSRTSTSRHKIWAKAVLTRAKHHCQIQGPRCTGVATIADHIIPVAEGGQYTMANGQGACQPCSDTKTQAEATRGLRRAYGHADVDMDEPAPF